MFSNCFPMYPGMNPYFPQISMPYYPHGMMPQMPMSPYPPYFPQYPPSMMPNMMPPIISNPSHLNAGPGAESINAALNLPMPQGSSDENIAGQLGNSVQLPLVPQQTNIPLSLLSANVPQPKSPQIGSIPIKASIPNEPEKTAPLPIIY